jgi:hypothetical protein
VEDHILNPQTLHIAVVAAGLDIVDSFLIHKSATKAVHHQIAHYTFWQWNHDIGY